MVQYRRIEASAGGRFRDKERHHYPDTVDLMVRGFDTFIEGKSAEFIELTLGHRLVRDTRPNEGHSLLDRVDEWTSTSCGSFTDLDLSFDEFLIVVIGILDPTIIADARDNGFVHPLLNREYYEKSKKYFQNQAASLRRFRE